ncbi:MAG: DnaJ C-terminal domain-containing protein [Hyphomonadaceae bacterium]
MTTDPYAILGVSKSADDDEIKRAYRKKAKALHPDLHPGDKAKAEAFKRASSAFDILGNQDKRRKFDRGEIDGEGQPKGFAGGGFGGGGFGGGRQGGYAGGQQNDPFEDILSGLFGGGGRGRRGPGPRKGRDVRYRVDVSFADSITGGPRRIKMSDGQALDVNIPAGVESGQTLRLKSQGQTSPYGGPPGDALVEVTVGTHKNWTRDGDDVRMAVPIALKTAVMGGTVEVDTPSGSLSLKVPEGSNTGAVLRLRGKGVQKTGKAGHLYARLEIILNDADIADLKKLFRK